MECGHAGWPFISTDNIIIVQRRTVIDVIKTIISSIIGGKLTFCGVLYPPHQVTEPVITQHHHYAVWALIISTSLSVLFWRVGTKTRTKTVTVCSVEL